MPLGQFKCERRAVDSCRSMQFFGRLRSRQSGLVLLNRNLGFLALAEEVQNEFDAAGDAQLVVNAEKIIADGVLAEAELDANFAVRESFGEQRRDVIFAFSEQGSASMVYGAERARLHKSLKQKVKLITAGPNLSSMNGLNAFAQHLERFGTAKYPLGSSAKSIDD